MNYTNKVKIEFEALPKTNLNEKRFNLLMRVADVLDYIEKNIDKDLVFVFHSDISTLIGDYAFSPLKNNDDEFVKSGDIEINKRNNNIIRKNNVVYNLLPFNFIVVNKYEYKLDDEKKKLLYDNWDKIGKAKIYLYNGGVVSPLYYSDYIVKNEYVNNLDSNKKYSLKVNLIDFGDNHVLCCTDSRNKILKEIVEYDMRVGIINDKKLLKLFPIDIRKFKRDKKQK